MSDPAGRHGPCTLFPIPMAVGEGCAQGVRYEEHKAHMRMLGLGLAIKPANSNIPAFACAADKISMGTFSGWGGLNTPCL